MCVSGVFVRFLRYMALLFLLVAPIALIPAYNKYYTINSALDTYALQL